MTFKNVFRSRLGVLLTLLAIVSLFGITLVSLRSTKQESQSYFLQAEQAIAINDLASAKLYLEKCLQREPNHVQARLYYGQLLREAGETERAIEVWQSIKDETQEETATARFLEGTVAIECGLVDQSRDLFLEALRLRPDYLDAREKLILIYQMLRQPEKLVEVLDKVRERRPLSDQELIFRTIPFDAAFPPEETIKVFNLTLKNNPADIESRTALAKAYRENNEAAKALEILNASPSKAAENDNFQAQKILAHLELNQVTTAADLCNSVAKKNLTLDLNRACGEVAIKQEHWENAVQSFLKVCSLNPNDKEGCFFLGQSLRRLGLQKEATYFSKRSVLLDNLNRLCIRLTQGGISENQQLLQMYSQIGSNLKDLNRNREAAHWYLRACKLSPQDSELLKQYQAVRELAMNPTPDTPNELDSILSNLNIKAITKHLPDSNAQANTLKKKSRSNIEFTDVQKQAGIDFTYFNGETGFEHLIESMGGGVIVIDYDGDGREDLYFPQGSRLPYGQNTTEHIDRLFRNIDGTQFQDVTHHAGLGSNRYGLGGVAWDFNNDGHDDLFVSNFGQNNFYINNGDGTFSDLSDELGFNEQEMSTSVAAADFNGDGLQDLYIANYVSELKTCPLPDGSYRPCDPASFNGQADRLLLNDGAGNFLDVSHTAGINLPNGKGLGVVACDFNSDGRIDVYVSNDGVPNFLFRNTTLPKDKTPTFEEVGLISGTALDERGRAQAGMGIALGDFNQDTRPDLYVTNFYLEHNAYYKNEGDLLFKDDTRNAGLFEPTLPLLGFGTQGCDFDNDGYCDLFVANGHIMNDKTGDQPWKMPAQLFRNQGEGQFTEVSNSAGQYFSEQNLGRGVAITDWNQDGKPDIVVVHQNRPVGLMENQTRSTQTTVTIRLVGIHSNRNAIGAVIQAIFKNHTQTIHLASDGGYLACNSRVRQIIINSDQEATIIKIRWPSGTETTHKISQRDDNKEASMAGNWILIEDGNTRWSKMAPN